MLWGQRVELPGLLTRCYLDDSRIPEATDTNPRREWIRSVVVHTTGGRRGRVIEGAPPSDADLAYARYQASTPAHKSWDYTVDRDGSIACSNDPTRRVTWHAGSTPVNNVAVGIEMVQNADGTLYSATIAATVLLLDWLTLLLGIQRQTPAVAGVPVVGELARLGGDEGGRDLVGIYGHRNVPGADRGPGDPGSDIFRALLLEGYEGFDVARSQDLAVWALRQRELQVPAEGIPGPLTVGAIRSRKNWTGLWITLPGERFPWGIALAAGAVSVAAAGGVYWASSRKGGL